MKLSALFIFLLSSFIVRSQTGDQEFLGDRSKDIVGAIDSFIVYFTRTVQDGDVALQGYYHFEIGKIVETGKSGKKIFYFIGPKLICVYDGSLNEYLYFFGEDKNASQKLYASYDAIAQKYRSLFDPYVIMTSIPLHPVSHFRMNRYDASYATEPITTLDQLKMCIIVENERYRVKNMRLSFSAPGIDIEQTVNGCKIPEELRLPLFTQKNKVYLRIILSDTIDGREIPLPEIELRF